MKMLENVKKNGDGAEKPTRETLTKAMQEERQERAQACGKEIEAVLKKHSCVLGAVPVIDQGLIKANVQIAAQ